MLFTNCSATLSGDTGSKKRHIFDGRMDPPKLVVGPKVFGIYYNNYYATEIIFFFMETSI